jgi:VanZ family protein
MTKAFCGRPLSFLPFLMASHLIKAIFWFCAAGLTLASLVPVTLLPPQSLDVWDKAQHAIGFAWLALVGLLAYPHKSAVMATGLLFHGASIELAQAATGWRYGEWSDLAADGVGILLGTLTWWLLRRIARPAS